MPIFFFKHYNNIYFSKFKWFVVISNSIDLKQFHLKIGYNNVFWMFSILKYVLLKILILELIEWIGFLELRLNFDSLPINFNSVNKINK